MISNLVGHMLDVRLVKLARKNRCLYSRYADDITFSTNLDGFPVELAEPIDENQSQWRLSKKLTMEIRASGFEINTCKTRMQWQGSRQTVTGLTVNQKVNIRSEYYKNARALCHQLFTTGSFYINNQENQSKNLNKVEGILSHIYHIKSLAAQAFARSTKRTLSEKQAGLHSIRKLYRRFLFFRNFNVLECPVLITEGETDSIYLKLAIKKLKEYQPLLGEYINGRFHSTLKFMKHTSNTGDILQLNGGVSKLNSLIKNYEKELNGFAYTQLTHPVVILIDNDKGAKEVFKTLKNQYELEISHECDSLFFHVHANLYLIKTPLLENQSQSCIEDFFDHGTLNKTLDGKRFDPSKKHDTEDTFGKTTFARKVVIPNAEEITFEGFGGVLARISAVLEDYMNRR